ncbi:MAG TPA: hypothetical protein VFC07_09630 [Verrucomicrobiae bacterium]|nr:hypothetical protein [Verrucomicrobiae bacterium]
MTWRHAVLALAFAGYCAAYLGARETRWLVHRASFETDDHGKKIYHHWIDRGDFGPGLFFHSPFERRIYPQAQEEMYWIFTPLRWAEGFAWHVIPRQYQSREGFKL